MNPVNANPRENRIPDTHSVALIGLCFFLASTGYLAWLYHIMPMVAPQTADLLSLGAGYLFQAAGLGLFALLLSRSNRSAAHILRAVLIMLCLCLFPAVLADGLSVTAGFGFALNILCGMLSGYFLYILTCETETGNSAITLGLGYSLSIVASWLLSLIAGRSSSYTLTILLVCLLSAAAVFLLSCKGRKPQPPEADEPAGENHAVSSSDAPFGSLLLLTGGLVFLFSIVNTCGFGFPSADFSGNVNLELSRLFYAAGLIIAGIANGQSRRLGALCAFASLIIPFLMLALRGEAFPLMIFWGLSYFAFGFYSVYRIILFSDVAREKHLLWLSGFGLLIGRVGDALGEILHVVFSGHYSVLIILNAVLFILAVFLFYRIQRFLYAPDDRTMHFDLFSSRHDLSLRERDVLRLLLQEKTNIEIADALSVSESTVKFHVHNILQKTGCRNRVALLALYANSRNV